MSLIPLAGRLRFASLVVLLFAAPVRAQVDEPAPLVVMNLAAHPDDEDGLTMAYYRHVKDAVVYSVLYTRGEGGQNEIGPDLYERLGALRTQETEAAARVLGTQVFYLNFYDFGFSKHASEAFAEWSRPRRGFWDTYHPIVGEAAGRDTVTARLVYLIRRLKPDVIFTNHDTSTAWPNAQHGQHQVVGISAYDAMALAADSTYHPEQLREPGVSLWQPKRLFLRRYRRPAQYDVAVPVGDRCGTREETCDALASRAVALHRSQGFDKIAGRFRQDTTYFQLLRAAEGTPPPPPGSTDLAAGLSPNPYASSLPVEYLVASRRTSAPPTSSGSGRYWYVPGGRLQAVAAEMIPGDSVVTSGLLDTTFARTSVEWDFTLPASTRPTLPTWRAQYERSTAAPPLHYAVYQGGRLATASVVPDSGIPLQVVPPVVVDLAPAPVRLVPGENVIPVSVRTYDPAAETTRVALDVMPEAEAPWPYRGAQTLAPGDTAAVFRFSLPADVAPGRYRVAVTADVSPTSAPAEPYVEWRPAALLPNVHVAEGLRVGFVRSYDRTTENALRAMGAEVVVLDSLALAEGRFDGLHTVALDIRAYLVRADLRAHNDKLLDWVRDGGHLVVGYHKTVDWNAGAGEDPLFGASVVPPEGWAPYPLAVERDRVTYEEAPVEVLVPDHPVFRRPHAITAEDWSGWVQERGLYFPETYDGRYRELLAMADPGEEPLRSGLLIADVGEGTYAYSSLAWYRQLEALNPGAWRLFANLVSLPLVKE